MIPGIDVSHWQGNINWKSVATSGERFAYIKATDGVSYSKTDYFLQNVPRAMGEGMYVGGYHFAQPRPDRDSRLEAQFFVRTLEQAGYGNGNLWLPGVYDIEVNPHGMSWAWLEDDTKKFAEEYNRLTGHTCIAYMSRSWSTNISYRPLWVAWWTTANVTLPAGSVFWQYTDSGSVPGISGKVDRNWFLGTEQELKSLISNGGEGIKDNMFVERGDTGPAVEYWQRILRELGFFPSNVSFAEVYGPATNNAVNDFRESIGLGRISSTRISPYIAQRLHRGLAEKYSGPAVGPTQAQIAAAVNAWLEANKDSLKGKDGKDATVAEITAAVTKWLNDNRDSLKGEDGKPGRTPTKFGLFVDVVEYADGDL